MFFCELHRTVHCGHVLATDSCSFYEMHLFAHLITIAIIVIIIIKIMQLLTQLLGFLLRGAKPIDERSQSEQKNKKLFI